MPLWGVCRYEHAPQLCRAGSAQRSCTCARQGKSLQDKRSSQHSSQFQRNTSRSRGRPRHFPPKGHDCVIFARIPGAMGDDEWQHRR